MKDKTLKPKTKFYTQASFILSRGAPIDSLYELTEEFEVTKDEIDQFIERHKKSKAISSAVVASGKEQELIYNKLDETFVNEHTDIVVFERGEGVEFYQYKGGVYEKMFDRDMYNLVDLCMAQYALFEHRTSKRRVQDTVQRISSLITRTPGRYFTEKDITNRKWYLNLKNGLLNMETFEIRKHSPKYFSTVQAPWEYDPAAVCPEFNKFISKVSNSDNSTAQMIQEMFGYCIMEGNPKHKVFYLYGDTARNGKSTTAKILCGLVGWGSVSMLSLGQIQGENSAILTSIVGKQINFSDEVSSKYIDSSRMTAMSAEGAVEVNPKFKPSYLYPVRAKFIVCCNDLPRFKDSQGMKYRMISIPFSLHIAEKDRIDRYDETLLTKEGSGILNWAIEGAKILKKNKVFSSNEESRGDAHQNLLESNSVYAYLESMYDFSVEYDTRVPARDMYGEVGNKDRHPTEYRLYSYETGIPPVSFPTFCRELKRFGRETGKIQQKMGGRGERYYIGLKKYSPLDEFN